MVSVVIPTFNRPGQLRRLLESVAAAEQPAGGLEVFVVDDGSPTPAPVQVAEEFGVRVLSQQRSGPAAARNRGWQAATGEMVVFIDDDCTVDQRALVHLHNALTEFDAVGAEIRPLAGATLFGRYMHVEGLVSHKVVDDEVRWLVTACAAMRREVLRATGGFDTRFGSAGGEDADLTFRISALGYRIGVCRAAVVWHDHSITLWRLIRTYYRHGTAQRALLDAHPARRQALGTSGRERLDPRAWARVYGRYREEAGVAESLLFVVLRLILMFPWLMGAARGNRRRPT